MNTDKLLSALLYGVIVGIVVGVVVWVVVELTTLDTNPANWGLVAGLLAFAYSLLTGRRSV